MPSDTYTLTRDKMGITAILDQHVEREEARLQYRWIMWSLAWYYLNGARRFDQFDPASGLLTPHYLDEEGNLEFQSQELLSAIDRVSGVISSMDVRARVMRSATSLQAIRDRSVAQILSDAVVSGDAVEGPLTQFAHIFTSLGSCGICGHVEDHPTIGLTADLEVIHPRELFPFPTLGQDYTKTRGLVRQRVVPLDYLKERFGRRITDNLDKLYWWEQEAGDVIQSHEGTGDDASIGGGGGGYTYNSGIGTSTNDKSRIGLVRIRELWIKGHRDLVTRYVIASGEYVIEDLDFNGLEVYCPIGFARFIENGSFHGAGIFDLLFSISRELERLMKSLFTNIRDIDRYGVVVLPQGQYNERSALRDVGRGLRVMTWDADPIDSGFKPFSIVPHNAGDVPGKTAAFAKEMMQSINPWQDLIANKGRVDSAAGLGFMDEKNRQLMTNATRAVEKAWSDCHRSILSSTARVISQSKRAIPVTHLTLDLAGAVIDPQASTVSFPENPLPIISGLRITIRESSPKSEITRKQEAVQLFGMEGLNDPQRFFLFSLEEGLDFAIWMEEEKSAYESIVRNCLLLYGDGETPGEVIVTPHTAMPELQLRVLSAFMAKPVMAVASPAVQDEFKKYREFLIDSMGMTLPAAVPNPDDELQLLTDMEQQQKMMEQQQQGPIPFPQQGAA